MKIVLKVCHVDSQDRNSENVADPRVNLDAVFPAGEAFSECTQAKRRHRFPQSFLVAIAKSFRSPVETDPPPPWKP